MKNLGRWLLPPVCVPSLAVWSANKRKVVPNASDAIVAMEQISKTDFYAEMKNNFKAYDVDLVDQGVGSASGSASGSTGATKGKEASVVYMPMPSDDSDYNPGLHIHACHMNEYEKTVLRI